MQSTLAKLSLCRTAALGGRRYRCNGCARECTVYNSCGDRHCPTCAGAKRSDWIDSTRGLLLDGVPYFQVVFTLPDELSSLALGNRRAIYDLLFRSAWQALKQTIESEQGYDPAALLVLHTWNQKLEPHAHVHAVVPGGGPAIDGPATDNNQWRWSRRTAEDRSVGRYLVDADALRAAYREAFLRGLHRLRTRGELQLAGGFACLQDDDAWTAWLEQLQATSWVSYLQPPPTDDCRSEQLLKYLARYLTGGPISHWRVVAADDHEVTFLARAGATPGGDNRQIEITLSTTEFVRRWCLHVLPRGYTKSRRYGGWSGTRRTAYLQLCREQLETTTASLPADAADCDASPQHDQNTSDDLPHERTDCCPHCGGRLILQARRDKPPWHEIFSSTHRPAWYRTLIGK